MFKNYFKNIHNTIFIFLFSKDYAITGPSDKKNQHMSAITVNLVLNRYSNQNFVIFFLITLLRFNFRAIIRNFHFYKIDIRKQKYN